MGISMFCMNCAKKPMTLLFVVVFVRILALCWTVDPGGKRLTLSLLKIQNSHIDTVDIGKCDASEVNLRYTIGNVTATRAFDAKWIEYLCYFGLLNDSSVDSASDVIHTDPVLVTAFSDNHFRDGLAMLLQLNKSLIASDVKLYLYDLGIRKSRTKYIRNHVGHFLIIKRFPFELFPPYVLNLKEYRWKVLVIADALNMHRSIWWMDSSVRVANISDLPLFYSDLQRCTAAEISGNCSQYPFTFVWPAGHSLYAATNPYMFDYFPIDQERGKRLPMAAIGFNSIFATLEVKRDVLKWWVLCALQKDCMSPPGHRLSCKWTARENRYANYGKCHRYEQSAANLLVAMANDYKYKMYTRMSKKLFKKFKIDRLQRSVQYHM